MPYLKWAGGKSTLLGDLKPLIGPISANSVFYDVFAGAGTVAEAVADQYDRVHMNDIGSDVSHTHRYVLNHGEDFIKIAKRFFMSTMNSQGCYLSMRKAFNDEAAGPARASMFIWLNKHGFNGLCRYNNSGIYNVPYGFYKSVAFPGKDMLAFHDALQGKTVVSCQDFETIMDRAGPKDVVYCDPPYWPTTQSARFTSYASGGFSLDDQRRLAVASRRCEGRVVISNRDLPETRSLYDGAEIVSVSAQGSISAKGSTRGPRAEIIAVFD